MAAVLERVGPTIEHLNESNFDLSAYAGPSYEGPSQLYFHGFHVHRTPLQILYEHAIRNYRVDTVFTFDNDSWPVRPFWDLRVTASMHQGARLIGVWRDELQPSVTPFVHASGLGIRAETISHLGLRFDFKPVAFQQDTISDFTRRVEASYGRQAVDRFRRSNRLELHPVFGGVYGDWIYHHHLGTRWRDGATKGPVTKGWRERGEEPDENYRLLSELTDEVFSNTDRYILGLRYGKRAKEFVRRTAEFLDSRYDGFSQSALMETAEALLGNDPLQAHYILGLVGSDAALDTRFLGLCANVSERLNRTSDAAAFRFAAHKVASGAEPVISRGKP